MTGGGGFAEDDVIFYNNFWANFSQFFYILLKLDKSESEFQIYIIINFHKRAISELKRIRDRSYLT